jgi:hypothetical protein
VIKGLTARCVGNDMSTTGADEVLSRTGTGGRREQRLAAMILLCHVIVLAHVHPWVDGS